MRPGLPHFLPGEGHVVPGRLREERARPSPPRRPRRARPPVSGCPDRLCARKKSDARRARPPPPPRTSPAPASEKERRELGGREDVLRQRPGLEPGRVGGREKGDDAEGDELHRRDGRDGPRAASRRPESDGTSTPAKLRECHGDGGDRPRLDHQERRPPEEKTREPPVGLAKEDVLAARLRQHCGQLRARECRGEGERARRSPTPRAASPPSRAGAHSPPRR